MNHQDAKDAKDIKEGYSMHVGFALLVDPPIHNLMRKLALEINAAYGTGLHAARLPPHISLKQPFHANDLHAMELYFDQFVATLEPFDVGLTTVDVLTNDPGIVWLDVEESKVLRDLHDRLNTELAARFDKTTAPFDGPDYHFHATVVVSPNDDNRYEHIATAYRGQTVALTYHATHIAMFYAPEDSAPYTFITYKILPLGTLTTG